MPEFKFNKDYNDKKLERLVKANEPVEMTIKRADEVVKDIQKLAKEQDKFKAWSDFYYERIDKKDDKEGGE